MTAEIDTKPSVENIIQIKSLAGSKEIRCRGCNNTVSRIKRGGLVKTFLFWLPIKRYVCHRCNRKTYRLDNSGK
jgi:transposase-like protein